MMLLKVNVIQKLSIHQNLNIRLLAGIYIPISSKTNEVLYHFSYATFYHITILKLSKRNEILKIVVMNI